MTTIIILGSPTYLAVSLLQMSQFGGTGAQALKEAIDSIFEEGSALELEDYTHKLLAATADGASVNFGHIGGLLKKFENDDRPWLVKIHCVNHRTELAVKDAFEGSKFSEVDKFYIGLYNLLKNSGAIKSDIQSAAESLDITFYVLPKMTGTRFVSHRKRSLTHLLHMWPAIITALENTLAIRQHKGETRAKIQGFIKKLRAYPFLCLVCTYLDVLEKITTTSLIFEGEGLLAHEIMSTIRMTLLELQDMVDSTGIEDELLDSHLSRFQFVDEDGEKSLSATFVRRNQMLRAAQNREYRTIELENFTTLNDAAIEIASREKKKIASELIDYLENRFSSFDDPVFENMKWFDPKNWLEDSAYGNDQIEFLSDHFETILSKTAFLKASALIEWKKFKSFTRVNFGDKLLSNGIDARGVWKTILRYRKSQFPSLCLLAQIIITLSGSNSTVERAFSVLTALLTDRRLKTSHDTIEMIIRIYCNDKVWSEKEREEIIERATDIHLESRRKKKMDESQPKRQRIDIDVNILSDDNEESADDSSGDESYFSSDNDLDNE